MNPYEVTVHTQKKKKKKKAENVDAAKRQETRKPNTHIIYIIKSKSLRSRLKQKNFATTSQGGQVAVKPSSRIWKIIRYSWSIINACSLLSHE